MSNPSLAVLMTCHNRRETTLGCLKGLYDQQVPFHVYLVDDGSTDGTTEAIQSQFPDVKVLAGDGNLFWVGGTHLAFATALEVGYDYYLWLNDDTTLSPNALNQLLTTHRQLIEKGQNQAILVGSTTDPQTERLTYGGRVRYSFWRRVNFKILEPTDVPIQCDTINGNCVLIPHGVAQQVGNLDLAFRHSLGDYDYGLRARKLGCSLWIAPGYLGTCSRNSLGGSWQDSNLTIKDRFKVANQFKGLDPKEWRIYTQRYGGVFWFLYWLFPYLRIIFSTIFKQFAYASQPAIAKNSPKG